MPKRFIPDLPAIEHDLAELKRLLPIPPGPWDAQQWTMLDVAMRIPRLTNSVCDVGGCETVRYAGTVDVGLCHGHYWRWIRDSRPPIHLWVKLPHRPVQRKNLPRSRRVFNFGELPPRAAHEIRFVFGTKLTTGDWTPNLDLLMMLETLRDALLADGASSYTTRRAEDWILLVRQLCPTTPKAFDRLIAPYLRSFFSTLNRRLIADPWAEDRWLWKGCFDAVLGGGTFAENTNISWAGIEQDWLREPLKLLSRRHLEGGSRAWGTIQDWARGFTRLSEHLIEAEVSKPKKLDREVYLAFLATQRAAHGDSVNLRQRINQVATVLMTMKVEGYQPKLGSEIYLRAGDNAASRLRQPRPWPSDVMRRIESEILENEAVDPQLRLMLKFARWAGPRVSELVDLPIDALIDNGSGGYWIEYWMPKVKDWRRFPVLEDVGKDLAAQAAKVREFYGPGATLMFPQTRRSNVSAGVTRPWSTSGFRKAARVAFVTAGITTSSMTGESIKGSDVHRFRHSIGTQLLNAGWTQAQVREFLGHKSETMVAAYARILDETLTRKVDEFHRLVQSERAAAGRPYSDPRVERLRDQFTAVTGIGFCSLPLDKRCSFRSNPCASCAFLVPADGKFRDARDAYRDELTQLVDEATSAGRHDVAELNQNIINDLDDQDAIG